MSTRTRAILAILKHALDVAHDVVVDGPCVGDHDLLAADLCLLLAATDRLLRRYCDALDDIPF